MSNRPSKLDSQTINKLKRIGLIQNRVSYKKASNILVKTLKTDIKDVSINYSLTQLLQIYDCINGNDEVIPLENRKERFSKPAKKLAKTPTCKSNRRKVRIDLTVDKSYAILIQEHFSKTDFFNLFPIKTGLAIKKVSKGFKCNVANYNELRTVEGVLHGNLYLNQIRVAKDVDFMDIKVDFKWFRGYLMIPNISVYNMIKILNTKNIEYLNEVSQRSQKRRLNNTFKLING